MEGVCGACLPLRLLFFFFKEYFGTCGGKNASDVCHDGMMWSLEFCVSFFLRQ